MSSVINTYLSGNRLSGAVTVVLLAGLLIFQPATACTLLSYALNLSFICIALGVYDSGKQARPDVDHVRNQLCTFVECSPIAVALLDKEMCFLAVSDKWYSLYSINPNGDGIAGDHCLRYFPEMTEHTEWMDIFRTCMKDGITHNSEVKFIRKDGSVLFLNVVVAPWYASPDKSGGLIVHTEDITELVLTRKSMVDISKELEDKVVARTSNLQELNRKLEYANNELEAFSYSVSHDLRAPLRAIVGFSRILEEEYGEVLDEEGRRLLGIVSNNAARMGELIDDMLRFSRVGRHSLNKQHVDMNHLFQAVFRELTDLEINRTNIEYNQNEVPDIYADASLIRQVIQNLLSNAIKYSSRQNPVRIEVGAIDEETLVTYFVKDNGEGFDMKYYDKLFGIFQRLHSDAEFEGTGIGLALVKRIIRKHRGDVWAESEPGRGASFYFRLPKGTN